jgi:D-xylose transport system ATP-binding protein
VTGELERRPVLIRGRGLRKCYGRVTALEDASVEVRAGEIVALVGDNAAGKTTLLKTLAGIVEPDAGSIEFNGETLDLRSAREARSLGIETVHQDLALCDNLRIFQNVFLGRELRRRVGPFRLLAKRQMRRRTKEALDRLGVEVPDVRIPVTELSGGQRQFVAIARAIVWDARVVLLDEPTAALSVAGSQRVLDIIQRLKADGRAVLIVSHDITHVREAADRIVVMRRGRDIANLEAGAADATTIVGLMTGALMPEGAPA